MFFNKICVVVAVGGLLGSFALGGKGQKGQPIGQVTTNAVVGNTPVPAGTTVFSGTEVSTQGKGAVIHLSNGESVELAPDSVVSFQAEGASGVRMAVRAGHAKVRTATGKVVIAMPEQEAAYSSKQGWSLKGGASKTVPAGLSPGSGPLNTSQARGKEDTAKLDAHKAGWQKESVGKKDGKGSHNGKPDPKPSKKKKPEYDDDEDDDDDENEHVASATKPEKKRKKK